MADDERIETDVTEPDGSHTVYRVANRQTVLEVHDARGNRRRPRGNCGCVLSWAIFLGF